jgi:hypothetical protein
MVGKPEKTFPMEFIANDPTVKVVIENSKIPPERVREVTSSILSIKVYGIKPDILT